jgi:hypothetical protein
MNHAIVVLGRTLKALWKRGWSTSRPRRTFLAVQCHDIIHSGAQTAFHIVHVLHELKNFRLRHLKLHHSHSVKQIKGYGQGVRRSVAWDIHYPAPHFTLAIRVLMTKR